MMEIIAPMYRQHPHEGQHPSHQPNSYNQYQNINSMNGRRSMSTHFDSSYPVYQNNHVGYGLQYGTGYDYVPQQTQTMVPSYHHPQPPQHHTMQQQQHPPSMYAPPPPLPPPTAVNPILHGLREHNSPQHSPNVKHERASPHQAQPAIVRSMSDPEQNSDEAGAKTDVDTLMKAIQARTSEMDMGSPMVSQMSLHHHSPLQQGFPQDRDPNGKPKKKYQCTFPSCGKFFFQKTHLEIHMRAHTGHKPFVSLVESESKKKSSANQELQLCREPNCGQRFSQLGNLKVSDGTLLSGLQKSLHILANVCVTIDS